jgi:hypothetical protein
VSWLSFDASHYLCVKKVAGININSLGQASKSNQIEKLYRIYQQMQAQCLKHIILSTCEVEIHGSRPAQAKSWHDHILSNKN